MAMLATPGAVFVAWLCRQVPGSRPDFDRSLLSHYLLPTAVIGILASSAFFLFQVGAVNQSGPDGMFDPVIAQILAQSTLGDGIRWRLAGFFLALLAAGQWYIARLMPAKTARPGFLSATVTVVLAAAALLCLAVSFAVLGHVSQLTIVSRLMLVLHVSAICLWVGSFVPLYMLCSPAIPEQPDVDRQALQTLMVLFGQAAWIVLCALFISGLWLTWHLLDSPAALLNSTYGQLLLLKLLLVAGLLALSARHKFGLVPALMLVGALHLRRSIRTQIGLAALILLVTAVFTTVTGPSQ
jgi:putative copper resistance protein D